VTGIARAVVVDDRLAIRAAYLYYRLDLTQVQVATRLGVSRAKVGRLLASARSSGIVNIDIQHPLSRVTGMEVALVLRYGLRDAVVASTLAGPEGEGDLQLLAVGAAGAHYLASLELDRTALALGWGTTMQAVAAALYPGWAHDVDVYQLNGAVPAPGHATGAAEIMDRFAELGAGRAHHLQVPAIVDRIAVREALDAERSVSRDLSGARDAPVAVFSLGDLRRESVLVASGYIDEALIDALRTRGAVGDLISRFVGADGQITDPDLDQRTMGLELESLGARGVAIGIAAGPRKAPIARAAIAGGHLNTLIVDDSLAAALLA
jgi:deoxyribonucleoside regulator